MRLSDLTDPAAVHSAMAEYDELGKERFLDKYGFRPSRSYFLKFNGKIYDSKAIVGAAYGFQHGQPMAPADFSGGELTVKHKLEELGFTVEVATPTSNKLPEYTSDRLETEKIYSRDDLQQLFGIRDASINTGIFQPKGTRSVWLFVTEEKTPDRTQYADILKGDTLHWQGQTSGRKDALIIDHKKNDLELLLFYRREKYEHPHAAFRYHGPVEYVSSHGHGPTSFILKLIAPNAPIDDPVIEVQPFDPKNVEDGRNKILAEVHRRQGQAKFRKDLLEAYGRRCAITGCEVEPILEAAHIYPYRGPQTNHVSNGLLLRADLHSLFDLHWITIDPETMVILVSDNLVGTEYMQHKGSPIRLPADPPARPSFEALKGHFEDSNIKG